MFKYFDTHCHLDMKRYDEDRDLLIKNLEKEDIGAITIGTDKKSSFMAVELAEQFKNLYATIGYHPTDTSEIFKAEDFSELVKNPKVVAIGECGLDYFRLQGDFKIESLKQKENFIRQIDFAVENNLPIVVHCRDAHQDLTQILKEKKEEYGEKLRGVIHFFSGDKEDAKNYLELGFYFSFGGVLTFADNYDEIVAFLPKEKILAETDAPFVAPVPYRGKRNEPIYVKEVYKKIAELKKIDSEEMRMILNQNILNLFKIHRHCHFELDSESFFKI